MRAAGLPELSCSKDIQYLKVKAKAGPHRAGDQGARLPETSQPPGVMDPQGPLAWDLDLAGSSRH